jgi:hypothetical protein
MHPSEYLPTVEVDPPKPGSDLVRSECCGHARTVMSMGTVEELADLLDRLKNEPGHPLRGFSNPRSNQPLFPVTLAAWATELAADLDARYMATSFIVVQVGHLNYPARTLRSVHPPTSRPRPLDPLRAAVVAVEHLEIRSGYDARSTVSIQNRDEGPLVLRTNGVLQSVIVDPANGEVIGSFTDAQILPLVRFQAEPEQANFRSDSHRIRVTSAGARLRRAPGNLGARGNSRNRRGRLVSKFANTDHDLELAGSARPHHRVSRDAPRSAIHC